MTCGKKIVQDHDSLMSPRRGEEEEDVDDGNNYHFPKCSSSQTFLQLHAHYITTGLSNHTIPLRRLLSSASLHLGPLYATAVLLRFPRRPTTFLFNTLISIFTAHNHSVHHCWSLYSTLLYHHRLLPNSYSYPSLLKSLSFSSDWAFHGRCVHAHIVKFLGGANDGFLGSSLLNFYGRLGKIGACRHLFDEFPNPDLATWNSVIAAYSRARALTDDDESLFSDGARTEALELFGQMLQSGVVPDEMTLVAVIGICGDLAALGKGMCAHAYAMTCGWSTINRHVGTTLIEMYGKCGRLDLAGQLFDEIPVKDTLCFNAMIHGLAVHGHGHAAIELYERMKSDDVSINDATIVSVMCGCAHAGLVEEGRRCFEEMSNVFGIAPKIEHYCCLIDLLCRAGQLTHAADVLNRMPMKPSPMMYRSLLGAYRIHGEPEFQEDVVRCLMKSDPGYGGNYVMLSNLYANSEQWDDARRLRKVMRDMGIVKTPAVSSVEVAGVVHEFSTGKEASHIALV